MIDGEFPPHGAHPTVVVGGQHTETSKVPASCETGWDRRGVGVAPSRLSPRAETEAQATDRTALVASAFSRGWGRPPEMNATRLSRAQAAGLDFWNCW
jgi:hypothetical protein